MIELSVQDVRLELLKVAGAGEIGVGEPATRLLGRIFHEVAADLVGSDPTRSGLKVLVDAGSEQSDWYETLLDHTYSSLVGPRIARQQPYLQSTSQQVLAFWGAVQELVRWLCEITAAALGSRDRQPTVWQDLVALLRSEVPLACDIQQPNWADSVRLTGIADLLLSIPGKTHFCALELKLGRATPSVDLGQAALYHLILSRGSSQPSASALALLHFTPTLEETLVRTEQLAESQARLLDLIGTMAGFATSGKQSQAIALHPTATEAGAAAMPPSRPLAEAHRERGRELVRAFREYGCEVTLLSDPIVGPRFVRYELRLGGGVHLERLHRVTTEVGLRLGLTKSPIVARHAGRLTVDIERPDPEPVHFSVLGPPPAAHVRGKGSSRLPVGVDLVGKVRFADLADPINAHLLVAGTTGSGKTEWLRTAIFGLVRDNTPETLRLVLFDPKQTAFTFLKRSPFLWNRHSFWTPPAAGQGPTASELLDELVAEMERRYRLFATTDSDDLAQYLAKVSERIPRLVVFCDEYYALLAQASRAEQAVIQRNVGLLGAKARAAGIHLVLAMQQASRKVIQGAIDTNIPCRVALMTQNAVDSRMVLGTSGAEALTGNGDLLYKDIGDPVRLQAPYLPPEERARAFQ